MLPGNYGFEWEAGRIVFLGAFYTVVLVIGITAIRAWLRARRDLVPQKEQAIRWHVDFEELPVRDRRCRHELTGEVRDRVCPNGFDCRDCERHPVFMERRKDNFEVDDCGVPLDHNLLYHRGHTTVRPQPDGTVLVALDAFANCLLGQPDALELPSQNTKLFVNGTGWFLKKGKSKLRILSPVEGTVVDTNPGENGWYLRVQPAKANDYTHLLKGGEASAWIRGEMQRLQLALSLQGASAELADGGLLVDDVEAEYKNIDWTAVRREMLLQP